MLSAPVTAEFLRLLEGDSEGSEEKRVKLGGNLLLSPALSQRALTLISFVKNISQKTTVKTCGCLGMAMPRSAPHTAFHSPRHELCRKPEREHPSLRRAVPGSRGRDGSSRRGGVSFPSPEPCAPLRQVNRSVRWPNKLKEETGMFQTEIARGIIGANHASLIHVLNYAVEKQVNILNIVELFLTCLFRKQISISYYITLLNYLFTAQNTCVICASCYYKY